jgi:hypothetical protein
VGGALFWNVRDFRVNLLRIERIDDGIFTDRPTQQVDLPATLTAKREDLRGANVVLNDCLRANGAGRLANHVSPSTKDTASGNAVRMFFDRRPLKPLSVQSLAAAFVSDFLVSDFVSDFDSDFPLLLSEAFLSASAAFL